MTFGTSGASGTSGSSAPAGTSASNPLGEYTPLLRDNSNRVSSAQHHLPIQSHYFDITDLESWPIAGLLVLLDGQGMPVRAELHLYDDLQPPVQDAAIRHARVVLQERYLGGAPVPVRILETFQVREEMLVRLPPVGVRQMGPRHSTARNVTTRNLMARNPFARAWNLPYVPPEWQRYASIGGAIVILALLFWIGNAIIGPLGDRDTAETPAATAETVAVTTEQSASTTPAANTQQSSTGNGTAPAAPANLQVSRNARTDLGIGVQVQVVDGLRVALRSEPSAERGMTVGEITDGDVATIVAGPEYTQGDTDTIVWWFVSLPNGTQAWVAANTSQQTLLLPAR
jgi:hypothetical protein